VSFCVYLMLLLKLPAMIYKRCCSSYTLKKVSFLQPTVPSLMYLALEVKLLIPNNDLKLLNRVGRLIK